MLELHDHDGDVPQSLLDCLSLIGNLAHFLSVLLLLFDKRFVLRSSILSSFGCLLVNFLLLQLFLTELRRNQLQLLLGFDEALF